MPGRLTASLATLLATLAVALAPCAGVGASAPVAERTSGCCGGACTCGDSCPCAAEDDESEPNGDPAPAAPTERNERRSLGSPLPATCPVPLVRAQSPCEAIGPDDRHEPSRPTGRALLSRISKWTT